MPQIPLILAVDLSAIIQAIIFLVILASGVAKMFRESKEVQRRAERPRPQPRPRPQGGGDDGIQLERAEAAPARQAPQENIRSEVEEFLRRVGQEDRGQQQPRRQPQRTRRETQIEILDEDSGFEVDDRPRQSHRKAQPKPKPKPQPSEAPHESVAEYVAEHMKPAEFVERASHLGEDVAHSDERMEARLHQKFDHRLGSLSALRQAREAADLAQRDSQSNTGSPAESLLELLSTPQGVQQAVILGEVLRRPGDRW